MYVCMNVCMYVERRIKEGPVTVSSCGWNELPGIERQGENERQEVKEVSKFVSAVGICVSTTLLLHRYHDPHRMPMSPTSIAAPPPLPPPVLPPSIPAVGDSVGVSVGVAVGDAVGTARVEVGGDYQRKQGRKERTNERMKDEQSQEETIQRDEGRKT